MDVAEQTANAHTDEVDVFDHVKQLIQMNCLENDAMFSKISDTINKQKQRVVVHVSQLNGILQGLASKVVNDPFTYFPPMESALAEISRNLGSEGALNNSQLRLGITGWLGGHSVTPRGINSSLVNQIVYVEGIVTRCSHVNARLTNAAYYVPDLERHFFRQQEDNIAILPRRDKPLGPTYNIAKDSEGHQIEIEYGLSEYKDVQVLTIQEMPEITPTGQLPRSLDVVCEEDLVDIVKPGDRVRITGVLRANTVRSAGIISGFARTLLIANNIDLLGRDFLSREITPSLMKQFKELSGHPQTLELIGASICPSISGHELIRKGLALQIVGGRAKVVEGDGTRLRGDIHILLAGDPSCGKSQLLRFMMRLSPICVSTTGRGSSAVGLTAAVLSDPDTNARRLEAGAMVLADGGLVCIDEFDKMSPDDRIVVHEVMEQQSVSINKAGISATLNARTSVLAAANPAYGTFDDSVDFLKQINFPDSLLSRFDLIFLVREPSTADADRKIAQQVLSQLRVPRDQDLHDQVSRLRAMRQDTVAHVIVQPADEVQNSISDKPGAKPREPGLTMWTKHPSNAPTSKSTLQTPANSIIHPDFLKLYVNHCRNNVSPELTDEACDDIANFYSYLRDRIARDLQANGQSKANHSRSLPTPRLLEACIRLSTAHAKLKMKNYVEVEDVKEAKKLLLFTFCGYEDPTDEPQHDSNSPPTSALFSRRRWREASLIDSVTRGIENLSLENSAPIKKHKPSMTPTRPLTVSMDTENSVYTFLNQLQEDEDEACWEVSYLFKHLKKQSLVSCEDELKQILKNLQTSNRVMIVGDRIYLI